VSRVLVNQVRPKVLMLSGIAVATIGLVAMSQVHANTTYPQLLVSLVLVGLGSGTSLVSLTSASLAGVDAADAGAASGLVNVLQQVGAALGLAVLVTVLSSASGHAQLGSAAVVPSSLVHALDLTFGASALFGLVALTLVATFVRVPRGTPSLEAAHPIADADDEDEDEEDLEWLEPELVA
jgi:Major Facilitator Superfamily